MDEERFPLSNASQLIVASRARNKFVAIVEWLGQNNNEWAIFAVVLDCRDLVPSIQLGVQDKTQLPNERLDIVFLELVFDSKHGKTPRLVVGLASYLRAGKIHAKN
jgi:hypothetical protein